MGSSVEQCILVTGGAGFIGTHTVVQLLNQGFKVSIIDNLDNSVLEAVHRVRELVGPDLSTKLEFNMVSSHLLAVSETEIVDISKISELLHFSSALISKKS